MMRKDDTEFKKLVDKALTDSFTSGVVDQSYNKWFQQPIQPKGLNLEFPMSDELKRLIANPSDKAADERRS